VGPARHLLAELECVQLGRGPRRMARVAGDGVLDLVLPDAWMSKVHAEVRRQKNRWTVRDLESKNGTLVNGERIQAADLQDKTLIQLGRTFFRFRSKQPTWGPANLEAEDLLPGPSGLATLSHQFGGVLHRSRAVAKGRVPILLQGESGTGKEVLARAIHTWSGRDGAFVAVNCGAIPQHLVESELFGHRKGAFSGAERDRPGLLRTSDGGTLFLDEIGDLPLTAQAALLRTLQESEVLPVGATRPERVDLRVVAATHRDLDQMVRDGTFRHDLLARLHGVVLELTPLRERQEDVALLIATLLRKLSPEPSDVKLSPEAAQSLLEHDWPLNVRELEQALAGALALSGAGTIAREHLPAALGEPPGEASQRKLTVDEIRHRDELIALLREHRGNLSAVARAVGKGRTQLVRWVGRYGLNAAAYR
jgi:sigma-54 dependent transcriptional regulator, acetoin dehydrogenase operon transcriptional activator AcoR